MELPLDNKIALVTCSSRAIGKPIALRLAAAGADVAVQYVRNEEPAWEVV